VGGRQGTLTRRLREAATLALHEALRQHAAASERLSGGDDEVLVA
jgi:hypothetical protein